MRILERIAMCSLLLAGCDNIADWAPPDVEPASSCDFTPYESPPEFRTVPAAPMCTFTAGEPLPCQCEDFGPSRQTPPGVWDPFCFPNDPSPTCPGAGTNPPPFEAAIGCAPWIMFAAPWCSLNAQLSGRLANVDTEPDFSDNQDGDITINVCPDRDSMYTVGTGSRVAPQELRSFPSFGIGPSITPGAAMAHGRIHMEWQSCRQYQGGWTVPVRDPNTDQIVRNESFPDVEPKSGDHVSATGDWVIDTACDDTLVFGLAGHDCRYTELHETRGLAVIRPDPGDPENRKFAFLTTNLATQGQQKNGLYFDLIVPPSNDPTRNKLVCRYEDSAVATHDCGFQQPGRRNNAFRTEPETTPVGSNGVQACTVKFECGANCSYNRADWVCCDNSNGIECFDNSCGGQDWEEKYATEQQNACDRLLYAGVITAEWRDPGDTWVCNNCGCNDPSTPNAKIPAPVQGCVPPGFDPSKPEDQAAVCAAICPGRNVCGAAPDCEIGTCGAPVGTPVAERLVESACDPERVIAGAASPSGDYLVQLNNTSVHIQHDDDALDRPVGGLLFVNRAESVLDIAAVRLAAADFETHDVEISDIRLIGSERIIAQDDGLLFQVPRGIAVFVLRAFVDGVLRGAEFRNPEDVSGAFDLSTGTFSAHIHAERPGTNGGTSLDSTLHGTVINWPPTADASRTPTTVECNQHNGAGFVLDSTASSDPDHGDFISHVQWFTASGDGLGNQAQQAATFALGTNHYRLHVYDAKLGSDHADGTVNVVDTTPPELVVQPSSMCLGPVDHKRVRLRLNEDIQVTASDICDPNPKVEIVSVTSDEPDNGLGDGDTSGDVAFGPSAVCVRRERSGAGDGRTYVVTIKATDTSGNSTQRTLSVDVPHNGRCRSAATVISDGAACN